MKKRSAVLALLLCALPIAHAEHPRDRVLLRESPPPPNGRDFQTSKRLLESQVYVEGHRRELYCGCAYDARKNIDFADCESASPFVPEGRHSSRASRMEWEHVVPASWVGREMDCWNDPAARGSRRDHCRASSPAFALAEGDMHLLFPSVGQLNAIRDDDSYGEIEGERHINGCDFEAEAHRVEPRDAVRGDVARATFYASSTYRVPLRRELYETLVRWDRRDPPDEFEKRRNDLIEGLQGNRNPYIDAHRTRRR